MFNQFGKRNMIHLTHKMTLNKTLNAHFKSTGAQKKCVLLKSKGFKVGATVGVDSITHTATDKLILAKL